MALIAKEGSTSVPVPAGVHPAVCYSLYDLGHHYSEQYNNTAHQVLVIWEIPGERILIEKDGEKLNLPRVCSKRYTLSLNDKANLRRDLESWRGRAFSAEELEGFDISKLIGVNCMIQIIHTTTDKGTYANISAILPLYKGIEQVKPENPTVIYTIDQPVPAETPKWIAKYISESNEKKGCPDEVPEPPPSQDSLDEVPF
jgi:hypothetical protein